MPMHAVGGGSGGGLTTPAADLPAVGAAAFLGASLSRYLAVEEAGGGGGGGADKDGTRTTTPSSTATAWEEAMVNLGALSAMVGEHLTGPVLGGAEPAWGGGKGGGSGGAAWPPSPATLALVAAGVLAVGVGVAVAAQRRGGGGSGWRWPRLAWS